MKHTLYGSYYTEPRSMSKEKPFPSFSQCSLCRAWKSTDCPLISRLPFSLHSRNFIPMIPKWAKTHVHPYGADISSQRNSELFYSIDENAKKEFSRLQSARRLEKEYLAYDTTSISSYSKLLKQVKNGNNKDHEHLAQINLVLVYGQKSRLPVCYRKLPGNITDVTTIKKLLLDLDFLNLNKVKLVMDRGFYSTDNINALYKNHYKFLITKTNALHDRPFIPEV